MLDHRTLLWERREEGDNIDGQYHHPRIIFKVNLCFLQYLQLIQSFYAIYESA